MFAERMRDIRKLRGHTQESLAELLNVGKMTISRWERGEAEPEMDNIIRLAKALNVSTDYLLSLDDEPQKDKQQPLEKRVLEMLRMGDKMGAVREIVNDGS